jgi:phospholipase C
MKLSSRFLLLLSLFGSAYAQTGYFQHVVVIVQENRTPDNLFGSNPNFEQGVDIATSGLNSQGQTIPLTGVALANCYDMSHSHTAFEEMYNNGQMNGADLEAVAVNSGCNLPTNPQFKYVDNATGTVQPYFDIASQYGWANRMFQTNQGPSFPAHQFILSGTSAPTTNSLLFASENPNPQGTAGCIAPAGATVALIDPSGKETSKQYPCFEHPTLTDLLDDAPSGPIDWRWYAPTAGSIWTAPNAINHMCVPSKVDGKLQCTGSDWVNHVVIPQTGVLTDIRNCALPPVSWVIPDGAESDHAGINKGLGPSWVASVVNAIGTSCGYWTSTAILITWDDWGGWYDHVPPYRIGQSNGWGLSYVYGFRVPLLVVSAYTPRGYVDNDVHDFGSILRFIETNFGFIGEPLGPIGPGDYADAYADDLHEFFLATTPRTFQTIPSAQDASYFLHDSSPPTDPDDDGDED